MTNKFPQKKLSRQSKRRWRTTINSLLGLGCMAMLAILTSGCGPSDPYAVVAVSGTLTYEGEPISGIGIKSCQSRADQALPKPTGKANFDFGIDPANLVCKKAHTRSRWRRLIMAMIS